MQKGKIMQKGKNKHNSAILVISIIAILVRILFLERFPAGIQQDEAFAGYLSYSLTNYGMDNFGYGNPVYFNAWGSGMSVLYSYLSIPFVKFMGLNAWAIRLPQAIYSILTVAAFYGILKRFTDEKTTFIGTFLLAISPWHIVMSRWGMDATLAPAFFIFGFYFFVLGLEKKPWLLVSALMYGLSLYCYATIWLVMPFVILFQLIYAYQSKMIKIDRYLMSFIVILGIMAIPLLLFLLINGGYFGEIRTRWFSIPKMIIYRGGEFTFRHIPGNFITFLKMFFKQDDGMIWNAVPGYGYYYLFSWPFIFIGFIKAWKESIRSWREKRFHPYPCFLFVFFLLVFEAMIMTECELNKINLIHFSVIVFCTIGVALTGNIVGKKVQAGLIGVYGIAFVMFLFTYTHSYNQVMAVEFKDGATKAVAYADTLTDEQICLDADIFHSQVLFGSQYPTPSAVTETVYRKGERRDLFVESIGRLEYHVTLKEEYLNKYQVFVWKKEGKEILKNHGFHIREFENYIVAYK